MRKLSIVLFISLMCVSVGFTQNYAFKVLANKGTNQVRTSGGEWQPLKTGASINSGDELNLDEGCYVGLLHRTGKTLEIKKEGGVHAVSKLEGRVQGSSSSVISKYADFVSRKMDEQERADTRNRLAATGAVERGVGDIDIYLPKSCDFFTDEAMIGWTNMGAGKKYLVKVKDMWDETIYETETSTNYFKLDFDDNRLKDQNLIVVGVSLVGEDASTVDVGIRRETKDDIAKFEAEYKQLTRDIDESTALNKLIVAEFFEQNNIMVDASSKYLEAITQNPDVEYFKEAYAQFLMRNNLVKKPITDPMAKE